jgi:hypothetical protein
MIFATLSRVLLVPVRYWFPRLAYQVVQYEAPAQAVRAVRGRVLEPSVLVETLPPAVIALPIGTQLLVLLVAAAKKQDTMWATESCLFVDKMPRTRAGYGLS